jgi:hypothetical protein
MVLQALTKLLKKSGFTCFPEASLNEHYTRRDDAPPPRSSPWLDSQTANNRCDTLVLYPDGMRQRVVDIRGTHPTAVYVRDRPNKDSIPGFYAERVQKEKFDFYAKHYEELTPQSKTVIPFAFESSGALAEEAKSLLKDAANIYNRSSLDPTISYPVYFRHLTETLSVTIARATALILSVYADSIAYPHGKFELPRCSREVDLLHATQQSADSADDTFSLHSSVLSSQCSASSSGTA